MYVYSNGHSRTMVSILQSSTLCNQLVIAMAGWLFQLVKIQTLCDLLVMAMAEQ